MLKKQIYSVQIGKVFVKLMELETLKFSMKKIKIFKKIKFSQIN